MNRAQIVAAQKDAGPFVCLTGVKPLIALIQGRLAQAMALQLGLGAGVYADAPASATFSALAAIKVLFWQKVHALSVIVVGSLSGVCIGEQQGQMIL